MEDFGGGVGISVPNREELQEQSTFIYQDEEKIERLKE